MAEEVHQNVLIVSDESETTRLLLEALAARGVRGTVVRDVASAMAKVEAQDWDLVVADWPTGGKRQESPGPGAADPAGRGNSQADSSDRTGPPDRAAAELARKVKDDLPEVLVIALGPEDSAGAAIRAMRAGCDDYLAKPLAPDALEALLDSVLPNHEVPLAAAAAADTRCLYRIVGSSSKLLGAIELARKVAPTSVPVLITGESGTGKELLAYLVHRSSRRSRASYIRVNCAALSESLLESELFGHERGAFTGAYAQRKGKFERAHGGTLLLDEVSETGPRLQAELLRVLEQQDFERVGGSEPIRVNVRVISTTNRDLTRQVETGRFRLDLYHRISGVQLAVAPLRERPEDIPELVWHFVNLYAREVRRRITDLDPRMLDRFARHPWPGNVRQLRNVVRAALILGSGPTLSLEGSEAVLADLRQGGKARACSLSLDDVERRAIFEALRRTKSNQAKAARLLGITDRTLREKLRRYRQDGWTQPAGEKQWIAEPV